MQYVVKGLAGESLFKAMERAGLPVQSTCGGKGTCGKCIVMVTRDDLSPLQWVEPRHLDLAKLANGNGANSDSKHSFRPVLSCQSIFQLEGNVLVDVEERIISIVEDSLLPLPEGQPAVETISVKLPRPQLGSVASEQSALEQALGVELRQSLTSVLRLGQLLKDENRFVTATIQHGAHGAKHVIVESDPQRLPIGAAVDIGTTTVVVCLLDFQSEKILGTLAEANVQRWAGADVIARIAAADNAESLARMRDGIRGQIVKMLLALTGKIGLDPEAIERIVLAGNPTMLHLLAGANPAGIAKAPFVPVFNAGMDLMPPCGSNPIASGAPASGTRASGAPGVRNSNSGQHLPLNTSWPFNPECRIMLIPGISAYVGADIVAGLLACGLDRPSQETSLFLDLGTNGEIVLRMRGQMWCCSAAAGPAFEGACIAFGSPSVPGAIDHVSVVGCNLSISVLGGGTPIGICGSGILDTVACLLSVGAIDETGRIDTSCQKLDPSYFASYQEKPAVLLDKAAGIYLTQDDIRQIQLAKAAIEAGVEILIKEAQIKGSNIDTIYLAGGFGSRLNPASAVRIGFFPKDFGGKILAVGNSSLAGAEIVALRRGAFDRCANLALGCTNIELSGRSDFVEYFSEGMFFPE